LREQERRTATFDYAPMNFGCFEIGIDGCLDGKQIIFAAKEIEKRA
jgi:hypothetical protein